MQVTHVADHVTHAVIGGAETIDFGISSSAEFFNILSSTLYKDQKLAVVREVLCNAWDAHVEAGCTDRPVIVSLTTEKFSVEDFGLGIPRDKIGPIYGTYGASTKKHDGAQTGGFGLGCKAPFAYTDHFEVQSGHGGEKTIYNMSKSAAQVMGKPGIIPIATFPSTDTGIKVTLELKSPSDQRTFKELVERIARNGEMNVLLNGHKVETIPFSTMKHSFLITHDEVYPNTNRAVFVRYGNVIYPVGENDAYAEEYRKISGVLSRMGASMTRNSWGHSSTHRKIVFQAAPHSISVTPSREELSMQEHTIGTLKTLMGKFVALMDGQMQAESYKVMRESIASAVTANKAGLLYQPTEQIPNLHHASSNVVGNYFTEINNLAAILCTRAYPDFKNFRKADILQRLQTLLDNKLGPQGLIQSYRDAYKVEYAQTKGHVSAYSADKYDIGNWFLRRVVTPLITKMTPDSLLSADRLMVYGHGDTVRWGRSEIEPCCRATSAKRLPIEHYLPYLRNLVVLSHSRIEIDKRVRKFPVIEEQGGARTGYLLYVAPRVQKRVEAARKFFESQGMTVLDLTIAQPWEAADVAEPENRDAAPAKPKKVGYVCASAAFDKDDHFDVAYWKEEDAKRITDPLWFARAPKKSREGHYPHDLGSIIDGSCLKAFIRLYGDQGAIITTDVQQDKLIKAGALPVDRFVVEQTSKHVLNSKGIAEWLQFARHRVYGDEQEHRATAGHKAYKMVMSVPELRKQFKLENNMTVEDNRHWKIFRRVSYHVSYNSRLQKEFSTQFETVRKHVESITTHADAMAFKKQMKANALLELFDFDRITQLLKSDPVKNKAEIDQTMKILLLALQG
jgi:hypothetical protein